MNATLKTLALVSFFSLVSFTTQANSSEDSLKVKSDEQAQLDAFDNIFEESQTLVIRFYNAADEEIFVKELTAEEILLSKEIQAMLQKSDFMLSMGNEYLYLVKEEE